MSEARHVPLPCACANLRRGARLVTALYDEALRPLGLRATQFTLLWTLAAVGSARQAALSDILCIDSTTLTRNLGLLRRKGWIQAVAGKDRRERLWSLKPAGQRLLRKAMPAWSVAQERLKAALGSDGWERLNGSLDVVVTVAQHI